MAAATTLGRRPFVLAASVLSASAALSFGPLGPAVAQDPPPRTTRDGVYTAEQAARGGETYARQCAACHPLDWYKGEAMKSWEGATLMGLYDSMATTMPQNNPGSLKRSEYVSLLAYILALNELPAGPEEIPESAEALAKIVIQWRKP
jgi:mono/diheme cytochrome c family protein